MSFLLWLLVAAAVVASAAALVTDDLTVTGIGAVAMQGLVGLAVGLGGGGLLSLLPLAAGAVIATGWLLPDPQPPRALHLLVEGRLARLWLAAILALVAILASRALVASPGPPHRQAIAAILFLAIGTGLARSFVGRHIALRRSSVALMAGPLVVAGQIAMPMTHPSLLAWAIPVVAVAVWQCRGEFHLRSAA